MLCGWNKLFQIKKNTQHRLDYGKKRGCTREEKEKERLKHKYKREFKGALREIRKDSRFLAREKLKEVMSRWGCGDDGEPECCSEMFPSVEDSKPFPRCCLFFLEMRRGRRRWRSCSAAWPLRRASGRLWRGRRESETHDLRPRRFSTSVPCLWDGKARRRWKNYELCGFFLLSFF